MSDERRNIPGAAAPARAPDDAGLRNVTRRYYAMWWGYSFAGGFLFGVYPLFLRSRGLNQFQINSVLAAYFVVMFLTDVPTGAFADAMGRRRSFVMGCAIRVGAFITYFFSHSFAMFLVAELFDGIGTTFCNGAIDAWGVDALDAAGFSGVRDRLFSRITQLTNLGFMTASVIGASVAEFNIAWPWLMGAAGFVFIGTAASSLMREERARAAPVVLSGIAGRIAARVAAGLRQGFRDRAVLLLSTANALMFAAWAPYWMQWPQLFNDSYGVGIWIIGWIYCLLTIARLLGAEAVARIAVQANNRGLRLAAVVAGSSALLFAAGAMAHRPNVALACLFVMNLGAGAMQPLAQSWFNERIKAEQRATLLSFASTFSTMGGSLGLLASGRIADSFGIPDAWKVGALILIAAAPCYLAIRNAKEPAAMARAAL